MNGMPDPDAHDSSPPEHGSREDLLARIVSGELAVDAEPVQAAMQADANFASEVTELLDLHDELCASTPYETLVDEMTQEPFREPLREPLREPWPGADDMIAALVQRELVGAAAPGQPDVNGNPQAASSPQKPTPHSIVQRRRWPWTLAALAAAAGLLLAISFWSRNNGELPIAPASTQLGPGELWPTDSATRAEFMTRGFEWGDLELPANAELTLTVTLANGTIVVDQVDVTGTKRWPLSTALQTNLPTAFEWLLRAHTTGSRDKTWRRTVTVQ
tara:strand:+ start:104797 stop:105621 length:825 start_codon:yes stop_codon:yes gene_type:complete